MLTTNLQHQGLLSPQLCARACKVARLSRLALNQYVEDLAFVVQQRAEIHPPSSVSDDDLVPMAAIRSGLGGAAADVAL